MIAVYVRVSTIDQNPESQRIEIRQWLERNRYDLSEVQWYEDKETGKTLKRPRFEQLQRAIFDGMVDTVVVWKLDRLARSLRDGINLVTDWIGKGIRIISTTQQIDLSGVFGQMIAGLLFAFAEMELTVNKERQAVGISAAKSRGAYKGRKKGTLKASPERAQQLKASGLKQKEIAAALGVSLRTVASYLQEGAAD